MKKTILKSVLTVLVALVSLNAHAVEIDGIIYEFDEVKLTATVVSSRLEEYSGTIDIPASVEYGGNVYAVTSIGEYAFSGSGLTSIVIPNSVTSIGVSAFRYCSGLTSVIIPNSVTTIGGWAFAGCSALETIEIPSSVIKIDESAFMDTAWFDNQEDGLIYVGKVAYKYKGEMPENTDITIKDGTLSISSDAFYNCSGMTSVTIPESVTSIGSSAFRGCSGLTSIIIPENVKSIGYNAFYGCSSLTSVTILCPQVGNDWFAGNESIKELTIGGKVTSISNAAFRGCRGLTNVIISEGITTISADAFANCSGLTSVIIPNSVTTIGRGAFAGCSALETIEIPNSVIKIDDSAFMNTAWFDNQEDGLIYVGKVAYKYKGEMPENTDITIKDGTLSISSYAFYECSSLTSLTIPESVTYIGNYAFSGCSGLSSIVVDEKNPVYDSRENCNAIIETATNTLMKGCSNTVIPNNITSIAPSAFSGCSGLTNVIIPEGVTEISQSAFAGCTGLTNVIIPEGVTEISQSAFAGCTGLTSITIPNNVTSIGIGAFASCTNLTSLKIPNSVTTIDQQAFINCENLASIVFPSSELIIGFRAFDNTAWYNNQEDGLVYAGNVAYKYKGEMPENTNITIKDGTVSIAWGAFMNCKGLTTVTIPSSVTSIFGNAFNYCNGLTDIYCYAESVPKVLDDVSYGTFRGIGNANLHVPSSSIADYKKEWGFYIIGGIVYEWVDLIENGDLEKESQFQYFYSKEMSVDDGALLKSRVVDGEGKDGTKGIVVHTSDIAQNPWDNQFYIILPFAIPVGTPIFVEFDYKASNSGTVQTSGHEVIGVGVSNGIGSVDMGTEWNHFKFASAVTSYVYANDIKCIAFDLNYIRQATDFYFDNISFKLLKEDWEALSNTGAEIAPMEKETVIAFEESITDETDLTNAVIENVYVTLDTKADDGYDKEDKCIVLTSTMTEEQVEGISSKDVGEAIVKDNFNGLILEVPAGTGTISIDALTKGSRSLNVKIGDAETQMFVQPERCEVEIPYNVTEATYVYIYGADTVNGVKHRVSGSQTENGVLIYGVKWEGLSTGINVVAAANDGTNRIFTIDGSSSNSLQKGVNIIRTQDGKTRKVLVK